MLGIMKIQCNLCQNGPMATKQIGARLEEDLFNRLEALAMVQGRSITQVLIRLIQQACQEEKLENGKSVSWFATQYYREDINDSVKALIKAEHLPASTLTFDEERLWAVISVSPAFEGWHWNRWDQRNNPEGCEPHTAIAVIDKFLKDGGDIGVPIDHFAVEHDTQQDADDTGPFYAYISLYDKDKNLIADVGHQETS